MKTRYEAHADYLQAGSYNENRDFLWRNYAGDRARDERQALMNAITGEARPKSKCGINAILEEIDAKKSKAQTFEPTADTRTAAEREIARREIDRNNHRRANICEDLPLLDANEQETRETEQTKLF